MSRLRSTATTESIPVIVFSGRRLDEFRKQELMREILGKPGVVRVLTKSSDTEELFSALRKFCGFEGAGNFEDRRTPHPVSR
jgi:CheY-like chemotaxis protein